VFHAEAPREKVDALRERGARLFRVPQAEGGLVLTAVLRSLAGLGIASLMVEGGAHVLRSFITEGLAA
jgi:riboflavin biosynthesis pyrimidine reductase